jgi:hypothetical protein
MVCLHHDSGNITSSPRNRKIGSGVLGQYDGQSLAVENFDGL